jgi:hypothetical protein
MAEDFGFDIEAPDLRGLIQHVRDFEPRLATALRREFRRSGDDIISAQRAELGSGETRDQIAAGLRTRVTAGATRQSVGITSAGPRKGGASLAKVFERRAFRHPVFGSSAWVDQPGHPYFNKPVKDGAERMRERLELAVDDILERIARA